jgi:hypothetical protein
MKGCLHSLCECASVCVFALKMLVRGRVRFGSGVYHAMRHMPSHANSWHCIWHHLPVTRGARVARIDPEPGWYLFSDFP